MEKNYQIQEHYDEKKKEKLVSLYSDILTTLGVDITKEDIKKTPERAAKALMFFTQGMTMEPELILKKAIFKCDSSTMVVVKKIDFYSLCEHHLVPFFGTASVGYIPNGQIVGLSKLPRAVNMISRKLQVQEKLTQEIVDLLVKVLNPKGVAVCLTAKHMCMSMRGVEMHNAETSSTIFYGAMDENTHKKEFLSMIA